LPNRRWYLKRLANAGVEGAAARSACIGGRKQATASWRGRTPPSEHSMSADGALRVTVSGWEDGQPMQRELDDPDRWAVQACESVRRCLALPPSLAISHANIAGFDAGSEAALSQTKHLCKSQSSTMPQNPHPGTAVCPDRLGSEATQ
jgi:hypothetical protein